MSTYIIHDNGVDREATATEVAEIETRHLQAELEADLEAKKVAKRLSALAKLKALGLTDAELSALIGA